METTAQRIDKSDISWYSCERKKVIFMRLGTKAKENYKWVIAIISFLMVATSLGFCSGNKSMYLDAVTKAQNIERSVYNIGDSIRYIATAVLNLFFGVQIAKFGPKKMILAGFAALIASCLLYSVGTALWMFYIAGALLGVGVAWCTTTVVGFVVARWFDKNQGTVMGIVMAANGLGVAVSAQIISPMIENEARNGFGYQDAYRFTALVLMGVAILALIFFKDKPWGYVDDGKPVVKKKQPKGGFSWAGIAYEEAIKKWYFWITALCILLIGISVQAASGHTVAHLKDTGLDPDYVKNVWSFHGLTLAATKILIGFLYDRLGLKKTLLFCEITGAASILMLSFCTASTPILGAVGATLISFALPLENVMLPIIAADVFGEKSYAKIMGIVVALNTAGHAIGSPLTDLVREHSGGTYQLIFFLYGIGLAVIAVVFHFVLRAAGKDREAIQAAAEA